MTGWQTSKAQWQVWAGEPRVGAVPRPAPLDQVDADALAGFGRAQFPGSATDTTVIDTPPVATAGGHRFDSMMTTVRPNPAASEAEPAPSAPLDVSLESPASDLAVTLINMDERPTLVDTGAPQPEPAVVAEPAVAEPAVQADTTPSPVEPAPATEPALASEPDLASEPAAAGETPLSAPEAAPPTAPVAEATQAANLEDGSAAAAAPSGSAAAATEPPGATDEALFIPRLTHPTPEPEPVVEPPPEEAPQEAPQEPPREASEGSSASGSLTSGVIGGQPDTAEPSGVSGGVIVSAEEAEPVVPPRSTTVVVDPAASASGLIQVDPDGNEAEELDAEELDAEELEQIDEAEPQAFADAAEPPPAPEGPPRDVPPPAPESVTSGGTVVRPAAEAPPPVPAAVTPAVTQKTLPPVERNWVDDVFGEHYPALLPPNHQQHAAQQAHFFLQCSQLQPGARILDVACGGGAHAVALAGLGYQVTGFDASTAQIAQANAAAHASGAQVTFLRGDMRTPPVEGPFEGAMCLGGSFGVFDDEQDEECLRQMATRLVPGGTLMLHVFNRDHMVGRLPTRSWWQGQGCLVLDEAQLDSPTSRVKVHRTVVFEDGRQFDHRYQLRAYGLYELIQACRRAGMEPVEHAGSSHTRGRFFGACSSHIWLLVRRT